MGSLDHLEGSQVCEGILMSDTFLTDQLDKVLDIVIKQHTFEVLFENKKQLTFVAHSSKTLQVHMSDGGVKDCVPASPSIVDQHWEETDTWSLEDDGDTFYLDNGSMNIKVHKDPFDLVITHTKSERSVELGQLGISYNDYETMICLKSIEGEQFYGTGLRRDYPLNNTVQSHKIHLNTWFGKSIPFYVSSEGYGAYMETSLWDTQLGFDDDNGEVKIKVPRKNGLNLYLFLGDYTEIMKEYFALTGKPFMPPKWSLGYWTGRYSYRTQEEVLEIANKFREKDIPCDLIFLDLMWRGAFIPMEVHDLTWDYDSFPEPEKMMSEVHDMGYHFFTHVNTTSLPESRDFSHPQHVEHWRSKIMPLIKEGADGFMIDGGEGKGMNLNFMSWNVPGGRFANGMYPEEMANIWGLLYNKTVVEAMRQARPNERMFGLTRAATAGSQRYGLTWFGDHQATWQTLEEEIMAGMGMSMSGLPFWTFDTGGTAGKSEKDLFIRWLQVACFTPVTRTHGTFPKEPWLYGQQVESIARKLLKFRMRLIPYLYSLTWSMVTDGVPMARPMVWEFPEDDKAKTLWNQWMLGPSILVAPIYKKDVTQRKVYLPEGRWLELETGVNHEGNQEVIINCELDQVGLFLRQGSILPLDQPRNHVKTGPTEQLDIYVLPSEEATSFRLYEDDGISMEYRDNHCETMIQVKRIEHQVLITIQQNKKGKVHQCKAYTFKILSENINEVIINGEGYDFNTESDPFLNQSIISVDYRF